MKIMASYPSERTKLMPDKKAGKVAVQSVQVNPFLELTFSCPKILYDAIIGVNL